MPARLALLAVLALGGLAACTAAGPASDAALPEPRVAPPPPVPLAVDPAAPPSFADRTRRAFARVQAQPYARGAISVVAANAENDLQTYRFVPCGTAICAGSETGPRGRLLASPDYTVVSGLYGGTFYFSPGGDGAVLRANGDHAWLAWEFVAD